MTHGDQAPKVVAFGHGDRGFESVHLMAKSPLGTVLMVSAPFLEMTHTVTSLLKESKRSRMKIKVKILGRLVASFPLVK